MLVTILSLIAVGLQGSHCTEAENTCAKGPFTRTDCNSEKEIFLWYLPSVSFESYTGFPENPFIGDVAFAIAMS